MTEVTVWRHSQRLGSGLCVRRSSVLGSPCKLGAWDLVALPYRVPRRRTSTCRPRPQPRSRSLVRRRPSHSGPELQASVNPWPSSISQPERPGQPRPDPLRPCTVAACPEVRVTTSPSIGPRVLPRRPPSRSQLPAQPSRTNARCAARRWRTVCDREPLGLQQWRPRRPRGGAFRFGTRRRTARRGRDIAASATEPARGGARVHCHRATALEVPDGPAV